MYLNTNNRKETAMRFDEMMEVLGRAEEAEQLREQAELEEAARGCHYPCCDSCAQIECNQA
jgi:hypothetical protein